MRTTLTLDRDVEAMLAKVQKNRDTSFKDLVNEALRLGLAQMSTPRVKAKAYETPAVSLGRPLIQNLDNISEVLAVAENESFK